MKPTTSNPRAIAEIIGHFLFTIHERSTTLMVDIYYDDVVVVLRVSYVRHSDNTLFTINS